MAPAHLMTRTPVARKAHTCWECTRPIAAGTRYRVDHLAYEGRAYTIKAHEDCALAGRSFDGDEDGRGPMIEEIQGAGEPLSAFDLPDAVRARIAEAFAAAKRRQRRRLLHYYARLAAERAA